MNNFRNLSDQIWVHLTCILWIEELNLKILFKKYDVMGFNKIRKIRFNKNC